MRYRRSPPGAEDDAYDAIVTSWGGWPKPGPDPATLEGTLRRAAERYIAPSSLGPSGRRGNVSGAEIAHLLWSATTRFVAMADAELAKFHLTMERLLVLREVATARAPLDMKSLARRVSVTASTISSLVGRLIRDGHLEHTADRFDRRVRVVKATIKGLYMASLASALVAGGTNRLARSLSDREKRALVAALERLAPPHESLGGAPTAPVSNGSALSSRARRGR